MARHASPAARPPIVGDVGRDSEGEAADVGLELHTSGIYLPVGFDQLGESVTAGRLAPARNFIHREGDVVAAGIASALGGDAQVAVGTRSDSLGRRTRYRVRRQGLAIEHREAGTLLKAVFHFLGVERADSGVDIVVAVEAGNIPEGSADL